MPATVLRSGWADHPHRHAFRASASRLPRNVLAYSAAAGTDQRELWAHRAGFGTATQYAHLTRRPLPASTRLVRLCHQVGVGNPINFNSARHSTLCESEKPS